MFSPNITSKPFKFNDLDPITFEILRNGFQAICAQGSAMLERVAYGPVITEGHDYSVSLLTKDSRLIAHGMMDHAPHIGTFEDTVKAVIEDVETIRPGDVYIFNDPYRGGTHTSDIRVIRPIFAGNDLFAFTIAICHWMDVGGPVPGTFNPRASECFDEGLHLPVMKLYDEDKPVKSTHELLKLNVRFPHERAGDMLAQYQATKQVEKTFLEYLNQYGKRTIQKVIEDLMGYTENLFRKEIAVLPDGEYEFEDFIDQDECCSEKRPVRVRCKLIIDGEKVTVDWTESDTAPLGPYGVTRSALLAATFDGTLHCFPHLVPLNNGLIRSINVISKPGTVTHVTRPTPVAGYCSGAYEKVSASIMGAWAQVLPLT